MFILMLSALCVLVFDIFIIIIIIYVRSNLQKYPKSSNVSVALLCLVAFLPHLYCLIW